jgi:hypothetical protein
MWITIEVERALYVDRGRDVILCDDHCPGRRVIVVKLSDQAVNELRGDLRRISGETETT